MSEPQSPYGRDRSKGTDHAAAGRRGGRTSSPGRVTQGRPSRIELNVCQWACHLKLSSNDPEVLFTLVLLEKKKVFFPVVGFFGISPINGNFCIALHIFLHGSCLPDLIMPIVWTCSHPIGGLGTSQHSPFPSCPIQAAPCASEQTSPAIPNSGGSPLPAGHQSDGHAFHSLLSSRPDPPLAIPQLQAPSPLCVVTCPSLPSNQASDTQSALTPPYPSLTKLGVALSKPRL